MSRANGYLIAWLVLLLAGYLAAFAMIWEFFVHTRHGQLLDMIALSGDVIGRRHVRPVVDTVLSVISVLSLVAATGVIGFIALIRRRIALALVTILLIAGANLTTQLFKQVCGRPDFGADGALTNYGNTLPSGHATVAASVAAGLVLALPPRLRGLGGLLGAGYAALTGVATLSAGWHRPSDAVAAMVVVGGWATCAGILLVLLAGRDSVVQTRDAHPIAISLLAAVGVALLAAAAVGLKLTDQVVTVSPTRLSSTRLFAAYAGSAAGVAGSACLMIALLLSTAHRVVARRSA
ncbi:phosphatase PAP2 family protein [Planosporangium thailandense]|uniref:Phosphatase PAP2 family protein n=1 Tax=Planosporangium thailandense TaxID=765197 RepID=A0ABX0XRW0_9ACTN|nr:phosphatase PAP2 family protein [Planosporangium thailandense]NJC68632.1 phosphatase PAP2 family protein [Planosporangium thailandense]